MSLVAVSRTLPAEVALDPQQLAAHHGASERFLWVRTDEDWSFVGLGMAAHIRAEGPGRLAELAAFRSAMADAIVVAEGARTPLLVGGASFDSSPVDAAGAEESGAAVGSAPTWESFADGLLVVPEVLVERRDGVGTLTAVAATQPEAEALIVATLRGMEGVRADRDNTAIRSLDEPTEVVPDRTYVDLVERGVKAIKNDELDKVVLAREVHVAAPADLTATVASLADRFPNCAIFAFALGDSTFFGATPERLVSLTKGRVSTMALAGSVGRGSNSAEDERLATRMLSDEKELAEHRFVVDALCRKLRKVGVDLDLPDTPSVVRLAQVQHLQTMVTGRTHPSRQLDVLTLAAALHPTPAVAGSPSEAAVDWIRRNEPLDRGWYAGPIGWCDLHGEGEIRVALRSALTSPEGCRIFAGAGIVAASDAEHELAETALKLRAVGDSLHAR